MEKKLLVEGKSKNVYTTNINDLLLIEYKNTTSCFNKYRCDIEGKGKLLNCQNAWWMEKTKHIINNHYVMHSENELLVAKCKRIDVEVIVRGYYTGSITKEGEIEKYGLSKPSVEKNQKLNELIITPTTKDEFDLPLTEQDIYDKKLVTFDEWRYIKKIAKELFNFGSLIAKDKGLILVDTKYEFGFDSNGKIILIDEIHTSDSSRFWNSEMENFDKDHLRRFVTDNPDSEIPENIKMKVLDSYSKLYNILTDNIPLVVVIAGSISDKGFVEKINIHLKKHGIVCHNYFHSAHKEILKVLEIINKYNNMPFKIIFVTVAGLSNALGGIVASNTNKPVINCPNYNDNLDMFTNLNSSLMMPSKVPTGLIINPENLSLHIKNIFNL